METDVRRMPARGKLVLRSLGEGGISLVEIMVASIVFLMAVLGAAGYFSSGRGGLSIDSHRRTAAEIAHSRLEVLRTVAFASLTASQEMGVPIEDLTGQCYTTVQDVDEDSDGYVDYRNVTVKVEWTDNNVIREVELTTIRSKRAE